MSSRTDYVILGLLSIEPHQSGYEMRKTIQGSVGYFWSESYGQLYPTLKRLTAEGLIAPSRRAAQGRTAKGRGGRQEYSLTAAGHARLKEWLALPYRPDPPRDEFLLKLFFGREAGPGVAVAHVRRFQEDYRQALALIEEIGRVGTAKNAEHPHFRFWNLTLEYGVARMRAELEWSKHALKVLEEMEEEQGTGSRVQGTGRRAGKAGMGKASGRGAKGSKNV